ncbi:hypothetical protein PF008_g30617 [Phytophthora fragariae]|uniref:Tc1-like transposase DDE domain-containing protein n=1 Tax=Phytophthora fragariae TaxID=53985 RepID=A0A6G0Q548_9STRA|nr:hypothetical protein PF008_g30617 [Phytophthora fragariae]
MSGKPATSQHIADVAQSLTGEAISAPTVRRTLRAVNCWFKVGERRDIRADSDANAAFRQKYLQRKRANLNKRTAIRTEVYLDESFCNLHHVAQRTWLLPEMKRVLPSGKGRRFCIIGAGAITRVGNHRTRGEWVKGSVKVWAADKAASTATGDYHGSFNSEKFERWFGQLCETLSAEYGECNIIMDGAKYHKRGVDAAPAKSKNMDTHVKWLLRQGVPASMLMKKKVLQQLVEEKRGSANYETVTIPSKWGHKVLFTPPYHPELQPIELIWAAIKNLIAKNPCRTMVELEAKIHDGINSITSKTWLKAYRHVQNVEEEYMEAMETDEDVLER